MTPTLPFPLPRKAGNFFTWWGSAAVPAHAYSGHASWSARRWGWGPLSHLVPRWTPAAAARWPGRGRPPTWPWPPLCTGACPCQRVTLSHSRSYRWRCHPTWGISLAGTQMVPPTASCKMNRGSEISGWGDPAGERPGGWVGGFCVRIDLPNRAMKGEWTKEPNCFLMLVSLHSSL